MWAHHQPALGNRGEIFSFPHLSDTRREPMTTPTMQEQIEGLDGSTDWSDRSQRLRVLPWV